MLFGVGNSPRGEIWAITALEAPSSVFLVRVESNKLRPVDQRENEDLSSANLPLRGGSARGNRKFNCSIREESYSVEGNSGAGWQ